MEAKERDFLRSEVATLEGLLSSLSERRVIERIGIEERLDRARERLAELEARPLAKSLPITFRGAPVAGMRSIDAGFGSAALKAFIDATDTVAASLSSEALKGRGRLPGPGRSLRIVDTAQGSFGFELELPAAPPDEPQLPLMELEQDPDPYASAITMTFALIADAAVSDEEGVSDVVADIHPRAAAKIHAFAKVLSDAGAGFAAEFDGKRVRLSEGAEVQRVVDALRDEDISEDTEQHVGELLGILPESRCFECRLSDGRLISGRVDRALPDIADFKSIWEGKEASLSFRVISIRKNQRFVLTGAKEAGG